MPMYKYRCAACGRDFEELLPMAEKDKAVCPHCGAPARRQWMGKCAFGAKSSVSSEEHPCACAGCPLRRE